MKCYILCWVAIALQFWFLDPGAVQAAQTETEKLPDAETVIEGNILAAGGYEVLGSERTYRMVFDGTSSKNEDFDYESFRCEGRHYGKFEFDSGRVFERGCIFDNRTAAAKAIDGIAWSVDNARVRELHGEEKQNYLRGFAFISLDAELTERCVSAKCVSRENIGGSDAYKLEIVAHDGTELEKYYDVETGLVVRTVRFHKISDATERADRPKAVRDYFDYKRFGQRLYPCRQESTNRGKKWFYNLKTFEANVEIPAYKFVVPDELADRVAKFSDRLDKRRFVGK